MFARMFAGHPFEIVNEGRLAVRHMGSVLNVLRSGVARDGVGGAAIIEHHFVKGDDVGLVGFWVTHGLPF